MPRYFFNIHDGHSSPDTEGLELLNWQVARRQAVRFAGEILKEEAERLPSGEEWKIEVANARGLILFRLDICCTEGAAVKSFTSG